MANEKSHGLSDELLALVTANTEPAALLAAAVQRIRDHAQAAAAVLAVADRGQWRIVANSGKPGSLPTELLSDVLDRREAKTAERWAAAPLSTDDDCQEVLLILSGPSSGKSGALPQAPAADIEEIAASLGKALALVRTLHQQQQRLRRLEALLAIAQQWNQARELGPLLIAMAEAATKLLAADRASIFLWDRPNHLLVGRPALGVESGELRIADGTGIVGQVIQTGEPRRVGRDDAHPAIDRQVDRQLGYRTESLLCVPLRTADGTLLGAFELINKLHGDFSDDDQQALTELAAHAATALANTQEFEQLVSRHKLLVDQAADRGRLIGECPAMAALRSTIARVADTDLAVLILGENGTGKEVVSQSIHYQSRRRNEPLVAVNCAAIPETLLESELFGHEKGAFTDARETRIGKFELAAGGTLFLDEIGDLSLGGQAKLLRVLEEKVIVRVGGSQPIHTAARIIAATNQNLGELVRRKKFREDLFFRLTVVTLDLPPLRDRGDDILLLADHFLATYCRAAGRRVPKLTADARKRLRAHSWPGNVRELRNLTERLTYLSPADKIDAAELEFVLAPHDQRAGIIEDDLELAAATGRFQESYIRRAIARSAHNMVQAAERLGLHRSNLYRKMRQLGMEVKE
ncbi:MAG: sigma-54-dependent Fis family transcriptional regulator [Planctomycetia bacterium]|nr:sigma-54-dependent Fis family transcriptional regulator [Planctomycetia bacterium]